jgi:hypothetical protein
MRGRGGQWFVVTVDAKHRLVILYQKPPGCTMAAITRCRPRALRRAIRGAGALKGAAPLGPPSGPGEMGDIRPPLGAACCGRLGSASGAR